MYANALMGAVAVIFDDAGHVLLVKQAYGDCNWALPGGYTEPHESIVETAVREVREETGLPVVADRLSGIYYGQQRDFHHFVFLCRTVGAVAEPRPSSSEVAACIYWPTDALPHPMSDLTRRFIRDAVAVERTPALPVVVASSGWQERVEIARRRLGSLAVVFNADGQVLLVKQTYSGRYWAYPGGFVEAQESITAAAVRETLEETGLRILAPGGLTGTDARRRHPIHARCCIRLPMCIAGDDPAWSLVGSGDTPGLHHLTRGQGEVLGRHNWRSVGR